SRSFHSADIIKHTRIIHIDTLYRIVTLGILRFLFNICNLLSRYFGNAKAFGIINLLQQNLSTFAGIILYRLLEGSLKNIIPKDNGHVIISYKIFGQTECLSNAAGLILYLIGKAAVKILA